MRDTAQIFLDNLASAEAVAKRLAASRATLAPLFPLKPERWETLTRLAESNSTPFSSGSTIFTRSWKGRCSAAS